MFDMAGIMQLGDGTCSTPPEVKIVWRLLAHSFTMLR